MPKNPDNSGTRFSLMQRIKFAFLIIILISTFSTTQALLRFTGFTGAIQLYTDQLLPTNTRTGELRAYLSSYRLAEAQYLMAEDDKARSVASDAIDAAAGNLFIYGKTLAEGLTTDESTKLYDLFNDSWAKYAEGTEKLKSLVASKNLNGAKTYFITDHSKKYEICLGSLNDLANLTFKHGEAEGHSLLERVKTDSRILKIALAIIILSGLCLSVNVIRSTRKALNIVSDRMKDATQLMSTQADQLSENSMQLKDRVNNGAVAIQQTMASLNELNITVSRNSELSNSTRKMALLSSQEAQSGETLISKLNDLTKSLGSGNQKLADTIQSSNQRMSEIINMIETIVEKTKIINDIGFQTKILSFNASVEAARAGEHGKGFSIVAEEVGTLANTSGQAAKEIDELLKSTVASVRSVMTQSQSEIEGALKATTDLVNSSVKMTSECETVLKSIAVAANNVSNNIEQISNATASQENEIKSINAALGNIETVTIQSAESSNETLSCSQKVSENILSMQTMVRDLMASFQGRPKNIDATQSSDSMAS